MAHVAREVADHAQIVLGRVVLRHQYLLVLAVPTARPVFVCPAHAERKAPPRNDRAVDQADVPATGIRQTNSSSSRTRRRRSALRGPIVPPSPPAGADRNNRDRMAGGADRGRRKLARALLTLVHSVKPCPHHRSFSGMRVKLRQMEGNHPQVVERIERCLMCAPPDAACCVKFRPCLYELPTASDVPAEVVDDLGFWVCRLRADRVRGCGGKGPDPRNRPERGRRRTRPTDGRARCRGPGRRRRRSPRRAGTTTVGSRADRSSRSSRLRPPVGCARLRPATRRRDRRRADRRRRPPVCPARASGRRASPATPACRCSAAPGGVRAPASPHCCSCAGSRRSSAGSSAAGSQPAITPAAYCRSRRHSRR